MSLPRPARLPLPFLLLLLTGCPTPPPGADIVDFSVTPDRFCAGPDAEIVITFHVTGADQGEVRIIDASGRTITRDPIQEPGSAPGIGSITKRTSDLGFLAGTYQVRLSADWEDGSHGATETILLFIDPPAWIERPVPVKCSTAGVPASCNEFRGDLVIGDAELRGIFVADSARLNNVPTNPETNELLPVRTLTLWAEDPNLYRTQICYFGGAAPCRPLPTAAKQLHPEIGAAFPGSIRVDGTTEVPFRAETAFMVPVGVHLGCS